MLIEPSTSLFLDPYYFPMLWIYVGNYLSIQINNNNKNNNFKKYTAY